MINGISFFSDEIAIKLRDQPDEILKWITQVQLSPTPLARAAYCENVLFHEIVLGVEQYVILGAGLDTFCFRNPELETRLEIFEVDYPSTQEFKKNRLSAANYQDPDNLHFISMDFTRDFILKKLIDSGFISNKKTLYSLLGVSYYLTKEEISNLVNELFAEVPFGSSIVFDYADNHLFEEKGLSNRVQNMVQMASASGEPMKSCFTYNEIEKLLENAGLLIYEHLSPEDINNQFLAIVQTSEKHLKRFTTFTLLKSCLIILVCPLILYWIEGQALNLKNSNPLTEIYHVLVINLQTIMTLLSDPEQ